MGISPAGDLPADEDSIDEDDEDSIDEDLDESIDKVERWGQTPD